MLKHDFLPVKAYFVYVSSEGPGETACMQSGLNQSAMISHAQHLKLVRC